jgi:hypothetical protein
LIPAVAAALDKIVHNVVALKNAKGAGRAYELMLMTAIAEELSDRACDVWLQRSDGSRISPFDGDRTFYQRGGTPTGVMGANLGPSNASSIVFSLPRSADEWEIWNGIQFIGRSGGSHEIDLAIVPRSVGTVLRSRPGENMPGGHPMVSIECKDVASVGEADEMRAFIARMYDLTMLSGHGGKIAHWGWPERRIYPGAPAGQEVFSSFWSANRDTYGAVARRTGFRPATLSLTSYYAVRPFANVTCGSAEFTLLVADVCGWIIAHC